MSALTDPRVQRVVEHAATTRVLDIVNSLDDEVTADPTFRQVCQLTGDIAAPKPSDAVTPENRRVGTARACPSPSGAGHTNHP